MTVATWGLRIDPFSKIACTLLFIAVDAFLYWLNQWARSKQLQIPSRHNRRSLSPFGRNWRADRIETDVANLRPIVLSMAAADQVRPLEFKVAFWQVALWGEIGFIGIWFFLMVGLTMENKGWKNKEQAPETFAQTVHAEETNRYSVVARKVVDLLNAGDYAAVQKLYNSEMSKAFPPKETSDFYSRLAAQFGNIEKFDGPTGNGYHGWIAFRLRAIAAAS